jgi:hypothetical protein
LSHAAAYPRADTELLYKEYPVVASVRQFAVTVYTVFNPVELILDETTIETLALGVQPEVIVVQVTASVPLDGEGHSLYISFSELSHVQPDTQYSKNSRL